MPTATWYGGPERIAQRWLRPKNGASPIQPKDRRDPTPKLPTRWSRRLAWATSFVASSRNSARSAWSTSCCPPAAARNPSSLRPPSHRSPGDPPGALASGSTPTTENIGPRAIGWRSWVSLQIRRHWRGFAVVWAVVKQFIPGQQVGGADPTAVGPGNFLVRIYRSADEKNPARALTAEIICVHLTSNVCNTSESRLG